jgi:hypothetical protein
MNKPQTLTLGSFLHDLKWFDQNTPLYVEVTRHDEDGMTTHKALVGIYFIGNNHDGNGIRLRIDEGEIKMEACR